MICLDKGLVRTLITAGALVSVLKPPEVIRTPILGHPSCQPQPLGGNDELPSSPLTKGNSREVDPDEPYLRITCQRMWKSRGLGLIQGERTIELYCRAAVLFCTWLKIYFRPAGGAVSSLYQRLFSCTAWYALYRELQLNRHSRTCCIMHWHIHQLR